MGFQKRWDCKAIESQLRTLCHEVASPYNDGWTASSCKQELYQLKCIIEDLYSTLPHFEGEEIWAQERLIQKLKQ
jgi:hypothetical protein